MFYTLQRNACPSTVWAEILISVFDYNVVCDIQAVQTSFKKISPGKAAEIYHVNGQPRSLGVRLVIGP